MTTKKTLKRVKPIECLGQQWDDKECGNAPPCQPLVIAITPEHVDKKAGRDDGNAEKRQADPKLEHRRRTHQPEGMCHQPKRHHQRHARKSDSACRLTVPPGKHGQE